MNIAPCVGGPTARSARRHTTCVPPRHPIRYVVSFVGMGLMLAGLLGTSMLRKDWNHSRIRMIGGISILGDSKIIGGSVTAGATGSFQKCHRHDRPSPKIRVRPTRSLHHSQRQEVQGAVHAHPGQPRVYMPRIPGANRHEESPGCGSAIRCGAGSCRHRSRLRLSRSVSSKPQRASSTWKWSLGADRGYDQHEAAHRGNSRVSTEVRP